MSTACYTLTMSRTFRTVDYEATLDQPVRLGDCLPPDHLARFIVDVIAQLDLSAISARYRPRGGAPYAPEILFGLLAYGYATGVFSSRKLERATYESAPFRFIAGNLHPDHDTIAAFRTTFLPDLQDLFVQVLLLAQAMGVLKLGNISIDGTKIHADASKSKAVSYKRLQELQTHLRAEVEALFALATHADQARLPDGLVVATEIALREERLARLAEAKAVLEARAKEREAIEQAEYAAKVREREAKARRKGKPPGGRPPTPPTPGPRDDDQYNFTDPESRIMKNSSDKGFNQHYNAQVAVDQECLLIVGTSLSNHPTDQGEVGPTLEAIPAALGVPDAAALDAGYFSAANIATLQGQGIEAYIATGREPHHLDWAAYFADAPTPPPRDASPKDLMAYKLRTAVGQAIYRLRKCTVEPVIGVIKEVLGFRQFSLRGMAGAAGEWVLVCLACNLKRLHVVSLG
jgi:transposase